MQVSLEYMSLIRDAAGTSAETVHADSRELALADLLAMVTANRDDKFRDLMLDPEGGPHPWLMVTVNDALVRDPTMKIKDGDRVSFAVPISGG